MGKLGLRQERWGRSRNTARLTNWQMKCSYRGRQRSEHFICQFVSLAVLRDRPHLSCRRPNFPIHQLFVLETDLPLILEEPILTEPAGHADLAEHIQLLLKHALTLELLARCDLPPEEADKISGIVCDISKRLVGLIAERLEDPRAVRLASELFGGRDAVEFVKRGYIDASRLHSLHAGPPVDF